MADRFWVGGSGTWNASNTTNWSATSGGPGGASVPGTADDVYFDSASNATDYTVTIGAQVQGRAISFAGPASGNLTIAGSSELRSYFSITFAATNVLVTYTGRLQFVRTNNTVTLTTNGVNLLSEIYIGSTSLSNAYLELGSALTTTKDIRINSSGRLNTNNYNVTCSGFTGVYGIYSALLTLGTSTFTCTTTTGFSFNGTASGSGFSGASSTIVSAGNVSINTLYTPGNITLTGTATKTLSVASVNNLVLEGPATAGVVQIAFNSSIPITSLSTTGTAGNRRIWMRSDSQGLQRALTVSSASSIDDVDFRDIIILGAAAPLTGNRLGDRGQSSGITYSAPKTVYWNLAGAQNWAADGWAPTSAGTPSTDNFPLPQDTAIFDDAGSVTGTITVNDGNFGFPTIDMSARTTAMTISLTANMIMYGSWINGSGTTMSGGNSRTVTFAGERAMTVNPAGKTFNANFTVDTYEGSVSLGAALTTGSFCSANFNRGTFNSNSYNITASPINSTTTNFRVLNLGTSTLGASASGYQINISDSSLGATFTSTGNYTLNLGDNASISNVTVANIFYVNNTDNSALDGTFTCSNITFRAGTFSGQIIYSLSGNITVTGTATFTGSSYNSRGCLVSNTQGTQRTLTLNAVSSIADFDFRDIVVAGAAAPISGTRLGNMANNSGITFDAPKTVYRVGNNGSWEGSSSWALTSAGAGSNNNFPLAQDTAVFDDASVAGGTSIDMAGGGGVSFGYAFTTLDCSARTLAVTFTSAKNSGPKVGGDIILSSAVSLTGGTSWGLLGRGNQTINQSGASIASPYFIDAVGGTYSLGSNFLSTVALTLSSGTFDAVTYNVTCNSFISSNSNIRTLRMGSGLWDLTGTGNAWNIGTITNLTFLKGTADILFSNTSTTARTFAGGGLSYNKLTIGGNTSTSTTTISGNNQFTELASTKTVAHTIALGSTTQTFGAWTVTGSAGNVVTLTGTGLSHQIAGAATSGIDYLAMGSIGFSEFSPGEFYAGANSTGTAAGATFRTAPPAPRTLYWVGGTGNWNDTARWSLSSGGAGGEAVPRSMDNVVFDSASNATAYTATVNATTRCNQLTIAGPASGNLTLAGSSTLIFHGNVTLPATGLTVTYNAGMFLSGSTTGKTLTTNGVTLLSGITIKGVGCEWSLGSALTLSGNGITLTDGSFDTANYNFNGSSISSNNSNTRSITLGSSTVTLSDSTAIEFSTSRNLTFNANTSQLNLTYALFGNGTRINATNITFNNVAFASTAASTNLTHTLGGSGGNTFNDMSMNTVAAGLSKLVVTGNQTINGTLTCTSANNVSRCMIQSATVGTPVTLTVASINAPSTNFRDITLAGAAAGYSPTYGGDCGGNSGVVFPAPKSVYWNLSGAQQFTSNGWASTSGGTPNLNNYPLPQDTAVFDDTGAVGTVTCGDGTGAQLPAINLSARTSAMTFAFFLNGGHECYGGFTNSSSGSVSVTAGSGANVYRGRGTMTFTSAGKTITFPITVDAPTGTFQLGDALLVSNSITHTRGTFDANNNTLVATVFSSNNSNTRTITLGAGPWFFNGTGTVWDLATTTGLTFNKDTSEIQLTAVSTTARTFAGGGLTYNKLVIGGGLVSTTTITGNNTFSEISETKTVANTIALGSTTQRVGAFTVTGTAGNVVTITGTGSSIIYTGAGNITGLDYLNVQGRVFGSAGQITNIWYAGTNSVTSGSLGWIFEAGTPPPPPAANANFFLLFA